MAGFAALLREMAGLEGEGNFEDLESTFPFTKCIRQGSVEGPKALAQDGDADALERRTEPEGKKNEFSPQERG